MLGPLFTTLLLLTSQATVGQTSPPTSQEAAPPRWTIAIHGGAGTISRDLPAESRDAYAQGLEKALRHGIGLLEEGAPALDVVEAVVVLLEDDPLFNAGKGAVFSHDEQHELDACIMDGASLNAGAVSGVTGVRNPIRLCRQVLDQSRHVFMVGPGAEAFGREVGIEFVDPSYFFTQRRHDQWKAAQKDDAFGFSQQKKGTVGCVVRDAGGHLAAATSTGGLTNKRFGRVGDVPVIGAGTYAKDATCAVSCTGYGERFILHTVAHDVSALMEYRGLGVQEAAREVIHGKLEPGDGGLIAVSSTGEVALCFNSDGMFRASARAGGPLQVGIWEETWDLTEGSTPGR